MAIGWAVDMKELPLTKGLVALVDVDDFEILCQYNWYFNYLNFGAKEAIA